MSFLRQNNRRNNTARVFFGTVLFAGVLFALNYVTHGKLSQLAQVPLSPLSSVSAALQARLESVSTALKSKRTLEMENEALRERLRHYELHALNNLALKAENEELRELTRMQSTQERVRHSVRVLTHTGAFPYGTLIVDNPGKHVEQGTFVYAGGDVAIGTVLESGPTVRVHLLSAPGRNSDAHVGDARVPVTLVGKGGGNFTAEIPRGTEIALGMPVVLSQAHGGIIGVVGSIEAADTDAFQTLRVRVPLPLRSLQFVSL